MISVIVPVCRAEKYIRRCIDSVLMQQGPAIELLLVDDGSPDRSGEICETYAAQDNRVRVFHISNGGAAHARNFGLDHAKGEFILFVDADDHIPQDHFSVLWQNQQRYNADMVVGSVTYVPGPTVAHAAEVCTTKRFLEMILYRDGVGDYPVGKLYRREMFASIRFKEGITSEDFEIFYRLYHRANTVVVTNETTYYYEQNAGSVSNGGFSTKFFNRIPICRELIQNVEKDHPDILPAAYSRAVDEAIWLYGITPPNYRAERKEMMEIARKYAPIVKHDPKVTAKVQRKIAIFSMSPYLWILRMKLKALVLGFCAGIKGETKSEN